MSILDGLPKSEAEWKRAIEIATPLYEYIEKNFEFTPEQRKVWQLTNEGIPLADILGITKEEREAVLAHACKLIKKGQYEEARNLLLQLVKLYPYDARVVYTTGITLQLEGNAAAAGKVFVQAIAMDATNPEGYLRLGECFLVEREYQNAAAMFEGAEDLCERGYGSEKIHEYSKKMLAHALERVESMNPANRR